MCRVVVLFPFSHLILLTMISKAYNSHVCFTSLTFYRRLVPREFNSYGSRRGNDAIMARGTFANIRLVNKFIGKAAPKTLHFPSGDAVR